MGSLTRVAVLGSTGSIGRQTLDVLRRNSERFQVVALSAHSNISALAEQVREFSPKFVGLSDESAAEKLRLAIAKGSKVFSGQRAIRELVSEKLVDIVVVGIVGFAGLDAVMAAIEAGKGIAIANKEALVSAGDIVMEAASRRNVRLIPVDSEHSSIYQCLQRRHHVQDVQKVILTASGGPFLHWPIEDFTKVTPKVAVKHPRWEMGAKISVDSATLANKGLEVIEAAKLFRLGADQIEVLVHPQSIAHGFVQFRDGVVSGILFATDMRIPIAYALRELSDLSLNGGADEFHYPTELTFDFMKASELNFYPPDLERFPSLALAFDALRRGGGAPAVYNAANEVAVGYFLQEKIRFVDIPRVTEHALRSYRDSSVESLEAVIKTDGWSRDCARAFIEEQIQK